jgi:FMN-dependent NADH-azoreductase
MLLFVNACLREGSRTDRLARMWLERRAYEGEVVERSLAELDIHPLDASDANPIEVYNQSVATAVYEHPMFCHAKEFAQADEVVLAAPMWNYAMPAKLADYLELVCTQGLTFDLDERGNYVSLTKAKRLTYIQTAGGPAVAPEDDHSFGYVRTLAERFWHIPQVELVCAWALDGPDADVDALLEKAALTTVRG